MRRYWERLSSREQGLAAIAGALCIASLAFGTAYPALGYLDELDERIDQLELDLINMTEQDGLRASVNEAFRQVVASHSSDWSEQEIHDRLRREIYRLSLKQPPPPDSDSNVMNLSLADYMVRIPRLREGTLKDHDDGYREYQIRFRMPAMKLSNLLTFIERIQGSDQLLRIDSLDISRGASSANVAATIEVTRTVVADPEGGAGDTGGNVNLLANGSFEAWNKGRKAFDNWDAVDCNVKPARSYSTDRKWSLEGEILRPDGGIYQLARLDSGRIYRLEVDLAAMADMTLSVRAGKTNLGKPLDVSGDGRLYRYAILFTPEGEAGEQRELRVPVLTSGEEGARFYLDNARLSRLEE